MATEPVTGFAFGLQAAAERLSRHQFEMVDMLLCAHYLKHGSASLCSDPRSVWVEAVGAPRELTPEERERVELMAGRYHGKTSIPPERCAVVVRTTGTTISIEYETRQ